MNDKTWWICIVFFAGLFISGYMLAGCASTGKIISDNRISTEQVGESLSELGDKQTESAVTAARITEQSDDIAESIERARIELESGTGDAKEFADICQSIRAADQGVPGSGREDQQ